LDFWSENKPSGNPDLEYSFARRRLAGGSAGKSGGLKIPAMRSQDRFNKFAAFVKSSKSCTKSTREIYYDVECVSDGARSPWKW
jgi:hypothetical protein